MLFDKVLNEIEDNKRRREAGEIIAIPFPFPRFSRFVPGVQKGRYILCTANSKVGKTKFTDYIFMYSIIDWIKANNPSIDVRINYFSLEMSKIDKTKEAIAYYLYTKKNIILPPDKMDSIFDDYILSDENLIDIKDLKDTFQFFEERVNFVDNIKNPYGIYKHVRRIAHENGYYVDKNNMKLDTLKIEQGYEPEVLKIHDYKQYNENIYYIDIFDHYSLFTPEVKHNYDLKLCIKDFSSNYCLKMRDRWRHTVIGVQQQANAQESIDNFKLNKLRPSGNGLADCKDTQRDVDMMLGLFAPSRHELSEWNGYDIEKLQDQYRELSVILNRRGNSTITNLWFNGASNYFKELPRADDILNMEIVYNKTNDLKKILYG